MDRIGEYWHGYGSSQDLSPWGASLLQGALLAPIRAMRMRYLPLLMVYFAYGALGLTGIAEAFWIKQSLIMTPAELAALGCLAHLAMDRKNGLR